MKSNLKDLIHYFDEIENQKYTKQDLQLIKQTCELLNKNQENLSNDELDTLNSNVRYLEIKYDDFNELSYYFDPIYIELKKKIKNKEIKKMREDNKNRL